MRKINTRDFRLATRTTSRDINRRIALNVIREHQPISRADLARHLNITRGVVSTLVQELIAQGVIYEGATGEIARGRKPTFLHIRTRDRLAIAVDVRFSKTYLMLCDFSGRQLALEAHDTIFSVPEFIKDLSVRIRKMLKTHGEKATCEGIGLVIPGMVDQRTGLILNAPALGWRGVDIRDKLAAATRLPVQIENSGRACALAQLWLVRGDATRPNSFVFISVSDGVGVGVVVAYISNLATLSRYFGWNLSKLNPNNLRDAEHTSFTVLDLIARARGGDAKAIAAIHATARFLGLGLGTIVNVLNPDCIYLAGEIASAWDLIEGTVRQSLAERALIESAARTPLRVSITEESPRLRGAAALIAAPSFAAPRVA